MALAAWAATWESWRLKRRITIMSNTNSSSMAAATTPIRNQSMLLPLSALMRIIASIAQLSVTLTGAWATRHSSPSESSIVSEPVCPDRDASKLF